MTERRQIAARTWRRSDDPARRGSDLPVPHLAIVGTQPAANQPDRREIGARLENWARWNNERSRSIGSSPTAAFCEHLRLQPEKKRFKPGAPEDEEAEEVAQGPTGDRRTVDEHDAMKIELAMSELEPRFRILLQWCYIKQAQPEVVCRKARIAHRPATVFIDTFRQAQAAVESAVESKKGSKK